MKSIRDFLSTQDIEHLKEEFGEIENRIIECQIYFDITKAFEAALAYNKDKNCAEVILKSLSDLKANSKGCVNIGDNIYNANSVNEIMIARMLPGIKYYNDDRQLIVLQLKN